MHRDHSNVVIKKIAPLFLLADSLDGTCDRVNEDVIKIRDIKIDEKNQARLNTLEWTINPEDKFKIISTVTTDALPQNEDEVKKQIPKCVQNSIILTNEAIKSSVIYLAKYDFPFWMEPLWNDLQQGIPLVDIKTTISTLSKIPLLPYPSLKKDEEMDTIQTTVEKLENNRNKILVIGDIMLNQIMRVQPADYLDVMGHNVSKEQDFSFLNQSSVKKKEKKRFGGAANVAYCCSVFSEVVLFGVIGKNSEGLDKNLSDDFTLDGEGHEMKKLAKKESIIDVFIPIEGYKTITKIYLEYVLGTELKLKIRMNRELNNEEGKREILKKRIEIKKKFIEIFTDEIDGIIFKDHQKGFVTQEFLDDIAPLINSRLKNDPNFIVVVDPKYDWKKFMKIDTIHAILPNIKEAAAGVFYPSPSITDDVRKAQMKIIEDRKKMDDGELRFLAKEYPNINLFIVKSAEKGACLFYPNKDIEIKDGLKIYNFHPEKDIKIDMPATHEEGGSGEIGCGDVFCAYFTNSLFMKSNPVENYQKKNTRFFYDWQISLLVLNWLNLLVKKSCPNGYLKI